MLSSKVVKKLKDVGFSIHKSQKAFLAIVREAVREIGGRHWQKQELPSLFRKLEDEIVGPLCHDENGPQLSRDTFKHYMSAARKSLLFGVPFRMAWRIAYDDLPQVKHIVEADKSRRTREQKVKDALATVRGKKRQLQRRNLSFVRLPLPTLEEGGSWVAELFAAIGAALDSSEAQILMRRSAKLRKLAELCNSKKQGA